MFALPTTSTLGLDLGPMTPSPSASSTNGTFAVDSYTPSEGCAGILLTVNLTCFNTMLPINDQEQVGDFRLVINDKKLYSRLDHGLNGNVTLHALLSTSLAPLSGLVPMSLHLYRDGVLFDYCNFGYFNFVPVPTATASPPVVTHTSSKRNRNDDETQTHTPNSKRSKFLPADPVFARDSHQAKLIIESDIAALGDLSTWSPTEIKERRRFVRLMRKQHGSDIYLRMVATSAEEVARDDRNVVNCMLLPACGDEPSVSSVDIIKALELLVNPPDRRLSVEERNRVRRNIDTLRPTTLKKGDESLNWIMQLRSPRPITIAKEVKIFKWSSLEAALVKIMKKYSYQNDGPLVPQRGSPTLDEALSRPTRRINQAKQHKSDQQTPPVPARSLGTELATSYSAGSPASPSAPPPTGECSDLQLAQQDVAFSDMITRLIDQNPQETTESLSSASVSLESMLSSDSSLVLGLNTPVNGNFGGYFDIERGCGSPLNGSQFLSHAGLEALYNLPPTGDVKMTTCDSSEPTLKLCEPMAGYQPTREFLSIGDLEALLNGSLMAGDLASSVAGDNWDVSLPPIFTENWGSQDVQPILF